MITAEEISYWREDYRAVTGEAALGFVCPITLEDDPTAELCRGHVLNQGIQKASRLAVVQRKDVDNYYGRTIEPDLIRIVNIGVYSSQELLRHSNNLHVIAPDGERLPAFFAAKTLSQ